MVYTVHRLQTDVSLPLKCIPKLFIHMVNSVGFIVHTTISFLKRSTIPSGYKPDMRRVRFIFMSKQSINIKIHISKN